MAKKLFVGNLSFSATESSLSEMFSQVGIVDSVKIITDMNSGRSRGFGFVEMSTDKDAEKAIAEFNGKEFQGRQVVVNEARPQESRGGRRRDY
jgi:RNA recognition motif-containing protein